ncbi:myosin XVIII, partial [Paragonimus westermani]
LRTIRRVRHSGSFVLNHNLSAFPVEYGFDSRWLSNSRLCPSIFSAHQLLQKSGPSAIKLLVSLLQTNRDFIGDARPMWTDNPSAFTEVKLQLDFVMRLFSSCATNNAGPNSHAGPVSGFNDGGSSFGVHWIHCLLPVVNAGLCQLISGSDSVTELPASAELSFAPNSSLIAGHPARICVNLIRAQLRGLNLIAILDEARSSFPDRITLSDFRHRYYSLISKSVLKRTGKCDNSQVFLKSFVLPQLNLRLKSRALIKSKTHPAQTDEQPNQADSSEPSTPSNCVPLSPIQSTHSPHITRSQVARVAASELDRLHLDRGTPDSYAVQPNEAFRVSSAGSPSVPDMQTYLSVVAKMKQANEDLKHCHEQMEQLTNQLRVAETAVDQLRGECDEAERRARKAEQRADELLTQGSVHQTAVPMNCEQDNSEFGLNSSESIQSMLQRQVELLRTQLLEANRKIAELTASQSRPTSQLDKNGRAESPFMELNELRKSRQELAVRVATLQSELDEVQHDLLVAKQARTRAEQNLEYIRADSKRLLDERDTDVEALRTANQTRIRQLEEQLDATQMEASQANRERLQLQHDLSTVRGELNTALETMDNETERKLLKDLKKYQTLLAEKETLLEQFIQEPPPDVGTVKQLRDRIDELDELNETNSRQKRAIQVELDDTINQLSTLQRIKQRLEDQLSKTKHESLDLQTQLEEQKTAAKEAQRQYQTAVAARSIDSATIAAQTLEINELLKERDSIRAELDELQLKFAVPEVDPISRVSVDRLELKVRELEQRLELESIVRSRLQTSLDRARETIEQLTTERDRLIASENSEKQLTRKLARQLREAQQAQDETARRAQLAQRRADEAMTQADQAIRQANSSREELSALARRKQDFKTWANQREQELDLNTIENEDTCSTYSAGDKDRWLRRPITLPIEPSVVDQALALATETSAFQRSRSLSLKRPRHRHARFGAVHTHRIMSAPLVGILRNRTVPCQKPALNSVYRKQPSPTHNIAQRSEVNIQRIRNIQGDTTGEQRIDSPTSSSLIESSDDEPSGSRKARLSHPLSVQTLRPGVSVNTVSNADLQSALSSPILIVRELEQCSSQSLLSVDQTQKQQEASQIPFDSSCDFVTMHPQTEIARPSFLEPQTPFPSPQSTSSEATFPFT